MQWLSHGDNDTQKRDRSFHQEKSPRSGECRSCLKDITVAENKQKDKSFNENWESEIKAYDEECRRIEKNFREKHVIIKESGSDKLTAEENEVLTLFLNGVSCPEIADTYNVETEIITGLLEIIQAKLSLSD